MQGIHIYDKNPTYWMMHGNPMLLLGGSGADNLFQWPEDELVAQLDQLAQAGGNYIRCTMSYRDPGNEMPYQKLENGKYDLDRFNEAFWEKFRFCLEECSKRDTIVQVEVWATYDLIGGFWAENPFNPAMNVNYSTADTSLPTVLDRGKWPGDPERPLLFYYTLPELNDDAVVFEYQQKFVEKLLSISLAYDNVLYCIDNEIWYSTEWAWGWHWSKYIRDAAERAQKTVYITEMYCFAGPNPRFGERGETFVKGSFDHPEIYDFLDISQTSFKRGQTHWDTIQGNYQYCAKYLRPINMVKVYGSDESDAGHCTSEKDGIEVFWRSVFGGLASARFHRPPCGQGLSPLARHAIATMRKLEREIEPWRCRTAMDLLADREENEAYVLADPGRVYSVYFPRSDAGGQVLLDLRDDGHEFRLKWLNIETGEWHRESQVSGGGKTPIATPDGKSQHGWACVIKR